MAWGAKSGEGNAVRGGAGVLSFIGGEVIINGNVKASGDMHLDGTVEGDLACGTLMLGASGRVVGNITADRATIAGTVEGTVGAKDLVIEKTARITGDVSYSAISIETGAKVDGRLSQRGPATGELKLVSAGE
jgi:cytoskeletal protein CcmA (bactofilin family)